MSNEDAEEEVENTLNFGIFKIEIWLLILLINIFLFIASYIIYRIIFFHGYQISLDKTLNKLQSESDGVLIESKKED